MKFQNHMESKMNSNVDSRDDLPQVNFNGVDDIVEVHNIATVDKFPFPKKIPKQRISFYGCTVRHHIMYKGLWRETLKNWIQMILRCLILVTGVWGHLLTEVLEIFWCLRNNPQFPQVYCRILSEIFLSSLYFFLLIGMVCLNVYKEYFPVTMEDLPKQMVMEVTTRTMQLAGNISPSGSKNSKNRIGIFRQPNVFNIWCYVEIKVNKELKASEI